jgi:2-polyprenyl-3-methyl-5-hydroxy-6-metoxy-1,4-benzoquinol methylase
MPAICSRDNLFLHVRSLPACCDERNDASATQGYQILCRNGPVKFIQKLNPVELIYKIPVHRQTLHMLDNYNERLFNGKTIRSKLHFARYVWLRKKLKQYNCPFDTILELGCFDGKTIEFLEKPPRQYDGYDANWEGGLELGRKKWPQHPDYHFNLCTSISEFQPRENYFDISVCQETLEHLPVADLDKYIERLAKATKSNCFITVPNEKGIVFLAKYITKVITQRKIDREEFTFAEIFYSTMGNLKKVKRNEGGHKAFDYSSLQKSLQEHFEIVETNGIPFGALPLFLNFTVGFVCKKKTVAP